MRADAAFSLQRRDGVSILEVAGDVDIANAADLRDAMRDAASGSDGPLVVSLERTSYFDSQTLEILIDYSKRMALARRRMCIVASARSQSKRLLDVSGITAAIPTFASVDDAVRASGDGS